MLIDNTDDDPSTATSSDSTSSSSNSTSSSIAEDDHGNETKRLKHLSEEEKMAFEDLVSDLEFTEDKIDEHLDIALDEEMDFLVKYKSLL